MTSVCHDFLHTAQYYFIFYNKSLFRVNYMNPFACAKITGNNTYPELSGIANFYEDAISGVWVEVELTGLPDMNSPINSNFYGMHIHTVGNCNIPFDQTGAHYNPNNLAHPNHAGDLPLLLGNNGYAYSLIYTNRFTPSEVLNKSIIIHSAPDDFHTQPSGNSGEKIGCGVIQKCG